MADFYDEQAQQPSSNNSTLHSRHGSMNLDAAGHSDVDGLYVPRPKRIACVVCRRRKLRCDGKKPSCGTCARLGHECAYDEVRKKSGPKRGYVKQLEARLAQVETLLRTQEGSAQTNDFSAPAQNELTDIPESTTLSNSTSTPISPPEATGNQPLPGQVYLPPPVRDSHTFAWDMISLGLEEPLPAREVIDELNQIYFEKIHPALPIIHRPRHLAAMDLAPNIRPPVCLQYITWSHAATVSDKYHNLHELFYQRARKYAELEEMKGLGEGVLSLACCQTWLLIGTYEFRMMCFPRAWLSVGKASRLSLMLGLNRIDGLGHGVKQSLPAARDWTEKEERRRVFWMTYCVDRYASVGTGWPVLMDDRDITTNLPASEEAFVKGQPQQTASVSDIVAGDRIPTLSPFGSVVFMAYLFGRNLTHLHRPDPQDNEHDLNGLYWQRHRSHDNILLHFALAMPNHLRLPAGVADPNVIFCNMAIHTSTICLHQAAIFKAEKNKISEQIATESKRRCIVAADQISNIMKMISHMDLTIMNPFMAFCVYIAARVFVQYLKSRSDDSAARSSLQFLFSALGALKQKNPLTESFLVQLDVDMEGTAIDDIRPRPSKRVRHEPNRTHSDEETAPDTQPLRSICPNSRATPAPEEEDSPSSNNSRQASARPPTTLPSRQKQRPLPFNPASLSSCSIPNDMYIPRARNDVVAPTGSCGGGRGAARGAPLDMDLSPGFTDASTNSTSTTTHNNSNTTIPEDPGVTLNRPSLSGHPQFAAMQNGSQHQRQQHQHPHQHPHPHPSSTTHPLEPSTSMGTSSLEDIDMVSGPYIDIAYPGRGGFPATGIVTPLDSTGSEGSMPMPSAWDFAPTQDPNAADVTQMTPGGMDSFNDAQWAQLLASGNWDAWRNHA
ncbi:hypothetical protein N8T08_006614 [Aspergillus melleus]|uniref:Uncharacterized protein n=1 Tax=Aspergillus melleus TaxID=138277 RepID=A0ACC3BFA7_9EURO|nr:hypothetical protein N8T08_006614 [Aspergillus melleus]